MKKILLTTVVLTAALLVCVLAYSVYLSTPLFDERRGAYRDEIAPAAQALSFARTPDALLLVSAMDSESITGRDLTAALGAARTADLIALYNNEGYEGLRQLQAPQRTAALEELIPPVNYRFPYIAAGTNFKEHAEEVYVDDPPFLFPKLARHSSWSEPVPFTDRLDYEAELCMFPLADIEAAGQDVEYGLVLCNDFTDRWTLVKGLDLGQPLGLTGFAAGKGCAGCLPTGFLAVIPQDSEFYRSLDLALYVNDQLRQRFSMNDIILPIQDIVAQAFALDDAAFANGNETVPLLPEGKIPRGTLILTGTAGGVIFKPLNLWYQGLYLSEGDTVHTEARYLGQLRNRVGDGD